MPRRRSAALSDIQHRSRENYDRSLRLLGNTTRDAVPRLGRRPHFEAMRSKLRRASTCPAPESAVGNGAQPFAHLVGLSFAARRSGFAPLPSAFGFFGGFTSRTRSAAPASLPRLARSFIKPLSLKSSGSECFQSSLAIFSSRRRMG